MFHVKSWVSFVCFKISPAKPSRFIIFFLFNTSSIIEKNIEN